MERLKGSCTVFLRKDSGTWSIEHHWEGRLDFRSLANLHWKDQSLEKASTNCCKIGKLSKVSSRKYVVEINNSKCNA